jgi:hypothetical protein
MLDRLKHDPDQPDRYRAELDRQLDVAAWCVPGVRPRVVREPLPPDAPAWWHGDEDASQSFLAAAGVVT